MIILLVGEFWHSYVVYTVFQKMPAPNKNNPKFKTPVYKLIKLQKKQTGFKTELSQINALKLYLASGRLSRVGE